MTTQPTHEPFDPVTQALRERGFELFVAVRVRSRVEDKLNVVKAVRKLALLGLKEAVDAVEGNYALFPSLPCEQAERVIERLGASGARCTLPLRRARLYAYMPEHERRGTQTCERLTVDGQTLALAQGQLGNWGPDQVLPVPDGELLAAIDRQREIWASAGLCEVGSELEIVRRVSARDDQLEERFRAARADALVHEAAVYGDWLQSQGDPRGHVASCALSLDAAQDDAERAQRASALAEVVAEHAAHLFGPVRALFDQGMQVEWMGPMLGKIELLRMTPNAFEQLAVLERLFELPVSAALRTLALSLRYAEDSTNASLVAKSSFTPSLRSLSLTEAIRLSFVDTHFERLEHLHVSAFHLEFTSLSAPALRRLSIDVRNLPDRLEAALAGLAAPALEHFEFGAFVDDFWDQRHGPLHDRLADLMTLPLFARLRSLTLRSQEHARPYDAGLAQALAQLPARATLERIDLRKAALAPEARAELEAIRSSLPELLLD